jgi:hypothetical protein
MSVEEILVSSLMLGGYRSFGENQRFDSFSRVTLLIGPNNSGKSNVLRFLCEVYPQIATGKPLKLGQLDRHFPNHFPLRFGRSVSLAKDDNEYAPFRKFVLPLLRADSREQGYDGTILSAFQKKSSIDGTEDAWFDFGEDGQLIIDDWATSFQGINDRLLYLLWHALTGSTGGGRQHWLPQTVRALTPKSPSYSAAMIPAIRRVGGKGSESEGFSGEGLIERLARLQNPDVHAQDQREKFLRINKFLKTVLDNSSAELEIPYNRDTIVVHMDSKSLPLESLGTGIHEVVILAAAATLLEHTIVCMEEPELHLNPILQKKLIRYLCHSTQNQYFITTHSAALMDTPDIEVYHVQLRDGQSRVTRVTSDRDRSAVCENLGYHPSDLLLANCIVWVEGPSDRLYLRKWISERAPNLIEGIHYAVMFYGGRLASHLSGNDLDEEIEDFISLRRLNRRGVIVIDSDRSNSHTSLNQTKQRLVEEFDNGPGYAWVTDGREIENYIKPEIVKAAISASFPSASSDSGFGRYDKPLSVSTQSSKVTQAPKVAVAEHVIANSALGDTRFELIERLDRLVQFIYESNPRFEKVTA